MGSGWVRVIVCKKCGFVHTLAFAPSICPKCASPFYEFGLGVQGTAREAIAKKTIFGWKFFEDEKTRNEYGGL